jgi:carboxylesterase
MHEATYIENPENKGLIIFTHGFVGSPRQFDELVKHAQQHGYSTAALLLPGHGGKAKPFGKSTMLEWQEHVDSKVEEYSAKYRDIWLVGHSMGGLLSLNAAIKYSDIIRGVFLLATPFKLVIFSKNAFIVRFKLIFYKKTHPLKAAYINGSSIKPSLSLLWHSIGRSSQVRKLMSITESILPDINTPVTSIYSYADEVVSIKSLEILSGGLKNIELNNHFLKYSNHAYYTEHEHKIIENELIRLVSRGHSHQYPYSPHSPLWRGGTQCRGG